MLALLAALLFVPPDASRDAPCFSAEIAISAGPVPARKPGDPPAPELPPAAFSHPLEPAPLEIVPRPQGARTRGQEISRRELRKMAVVPGVSLASAVLTPVGLGLRSGDWGSPALEMSAGYMGGYLGTVAAIATTGLVEWLGPVPDPRIGFNRLAAVVAFTGMALLPAAGTGLAVFHTGEALQGRSLNRGENLFAAMGGAFATEAVLLVAAVATNAPVGPIATLAFLPIAAGATVAYDLSRGPHRGPRRAALPIFVMRF